MAIKTSYPNINIRDLVKGYKDGGETVIANCQMLCNNCHSDVTARQNQNPQEKSKT